MLYCNVCFDTTGYVSPGVMECLSFRVTAELFLLARAGQRGAPPAGRCLALRLLPQDVESFFRVTRFQQMLPVLCSICRYYREGVITRCRVGTLCESFRTKVQVWDGDNDLTLFFRLTYRRRFFISNLWLKIRTHGVVQ